MLWQTERLATVSYLTLMNGLPLEGQRAGPQPRPGLWWPDHGSRDRMAKGAAAKREPALTRPPAP